MLKGQGSKFGALLIGSAIIAFSTSMSASTSLKAQTFVCKPAMMAQRYFKDTHFVGKIPAKYYNATVKSWQRKARKKYGPPFENFENAAKRNRTCTTIQNRIHCKAYGQPCSSTARKITSSPNVAPRCKPIRIRKQRKSSDTQAILWARWRKAVIRDYGRLYGDRSKAQVASYTCVYPKTPTPGFGGGGAIGSVKICQVRARPCRY